MAKAARQSSAPKSAFQQAAAASVSAFQTARQNERKLGGGFSVPVINDGEYAVQIQEVICGVGTGQVEGKPVVRIKGVVIDHAEFEGVQLDTFDVIAESRYDTLETAWDKVLNRFLGIGYEFGADVTLADLESAAADATASKPQVLARVKNGKKGDGSPKVTTYWQGLLDTGSEEEEVEYEEEVEEVEEEIEEEAPPPRKAAPKKAVKGKR